MRSKYVPNKDIMFSTSSFRSLHRKNKRKTKSRGPRFFRAAVAAVLSQLKIRAFYLLYEVKAEKKKEGPLLRGIYYKKGLSHTIWDHTRRVMSLLQMNSAPLEIYGKRVH